MHMAQPGPRGKNLARLVACFYCAARMARNLKHIQARPRVNARIGSSLRAWLGRGRGGRRASLLVRPGRWRELARVAKKSAGGFRLTSRRVHPYLAPPSPSQLPPPFSLCSSFPADAHRHRRAGKRRIFIGRRSTASALLHRPVLIFHDRPPSSSNCSHGLCEFNPLSLCSF